MAFTRNETWSVNFISDELFNGDRIRLFTSVDNFTRESPPIELARSIPSRRVVAALDRVADERGLPKTFQVDNATVFTSKVLGQWDYANGVELDFSTPGKPTDNAFIESLNGRARQECLNENLLLSLEDARQ